MRFVIMADGKGTRWNNYLGLPKHLACVNGEPVLGRTIRLLNAMAPDGPEVIVTSHDDRYEFDGARRYEPKNNVYEIDRFTEELIVDDMCFLYGDTYYTDNAIKQILEAQTDDLMFFGNSKSIVAIKIISAQVFKTHVTAVKDAYLAGQVEKCKGWQVYQSFVGHELSAPVSIDKKFVFIDGETNDINTPEEYEAI